MKKDIENKVIFGVCAGIAKSMNLDPVLVRIAFLGFTLLGFGLPVIIYLILALITPAKSKGEES